MILFSVSALISASSKNFVTIESKEQLQKEMDSQETIVIKWHATWCGACSAYKKLFEDYAIEYPDVKFLDVDVDKLGDISQKYQIKFLPTTTFIRNKKEFSRKSGPIQKDEFKAILEKKDVKKKEVTKEDKDESQSKEKDTLLDKAKNFVKTITTPIRKIFS